KQLGSVRPLGEQEMKELLDLKKRIGFSDPRVGENVAPEKMTCGGVDYISRVSGEIGSKGRIATPTGGTAPVPTQSELRPMTAVQASPMEQAIHSLIPQNVSDADVEQL